MKWLCHPVIIFSLLGSVSVSPAAQPPPDVQAPTLEEVVVTGTADHESGSPASPGIETAQAQLHAVPGAVSVASPEDYQRGRGAYLEDFLRFQPGVVLQSGQGSEDTKLSIRGSGVQNDDILGVTVLIDGIPLNQADGEAYLHDLDLSSVKYTELYRGADALKYGGVTLGGALNLVTYTGRDTGPLTARASFGSFGFTEQELTSGWSDEQWDADVSLLNHTLDGYRQWSEENYQKAFFSLGFRPSESFENRLYFFYGRLEQNNPSSLTKADMYADPTQTDPEAIQEKWHTHWTYERVMDRAVYQGDDYQIQASLEWNHRQVTQNQEFEDDFRLGAVRYHSDDFGADLAFDTEAEFLHGRNHFSAGIVPTFEPESDSFYSDEDGNLGALLFTDRTYYLNVPLYMENRHYFTKQFSLLTGFQVSYVDRIFHDNYQSPTLGDQSHDDHFLAFNPKIGAAYEFNADSLAYVNFSRSFQPPSFDESLGVAEGEDGGQQFHELDSQKAWTLEFGTRGKAGPFDWDVALFRSWVRDELLDQNNTQGQPLGTVNAPKTTHQGLEAELETELTHSILTPRGQGKQDRLVLQQSYTLSDFRFSNNPAYGNNRIAGTLEQFYKAELRYEHPSGFYLGVNVEWNPVKYPVDEANTLYADPYALLGMRMGYQTRKGFNIFFEAKNLTDKTYAASVEPIADARTGDDTDSFNPGNGRAFYGGVSWAY